MLALNEGINSQFDSLFKETVSGGVLKSRDCMIVVLTASLLLGDQEAFENAVMTAKQLGLNSKEIGQIRALATIRSQKTKKKLDASILPHHPEQTKYCERKCNLCNENKK